MHDELHRQDNGVMARLRVPTSLRGPHSGSVLRNLSWLARVAAFVLIGIETFIHSPAGSADLIIAATAYLLCGLLLCGWAVAELRTPNHQNGLLPMLGLTAALSGAASTVTHGHALLGLTLLVVVSAGSAGSVAVGWAVTAAGVLGIAVSGLLTGSDRAVLLGYPAALLLALLVGSNRRTYRVHAEETSALLAQVEQLQAGQRRAAVLDERTRIAREIHDVLAHSLGALGIQIQTARALLDHDTRRADEVLEVAQRMAADGLGETRRAVQALRADIAPLPQSLAEISDAHRGRHGTSAELTIHGEPATLPSEQILALVRVTQESLVNAAKHAPGQSVDITLYYEDEHVNLTIINLLTGQQADGSGFDTVNGGYGLTGMRERLLLLGGSLTAEPTNHRWQVTARVPR
ncbi:sensor histidine kinase [Kribbella sp. NBC_00382]|uniref:sensor histidine kinase n=1 Tax=Kribbella sp. NBC_00382 TaxID=2975967 RepID=UPI002E237ABE